MSLGISRLTLSISAVRLLFLLRVLASAGWLELATKARQAYLWWPSAAMYTTRGR